MQAGLLAPLLASMVFGAVAASVLAWPLPRPAPIAELRLPEVETPRPAPTTPGRTAAEVATILAHPLFNTTRRPSTDPDRNAEAPLPRLSAIVVSGTSRRAVFEISGSTPLVVGIDGQAGPYVVHAIAATAVMVATASGEKVLRPVPLSSDGRTAANVEAMLEPSTFLATSFDKQMQHRGSPTRTP